MRADILTRCVRSWPLIPHLLWKSQAADHMPLRQLNISPHLGSPHLRRTEGILGAVLILNSGGMLMQMTWRLLVGAASFVNTWTLTRACPAFSRVPQSKWNVIDPPTRHSSHWQLTMGRRPGKRHHQSLNTEIHLQKYPSPIKLPGLTADIHAKQANPPVLGTGNFRRQINIKLPSRCIANLSTFLHPNSRNFQRTIENASSHFFNSNETERLFVFF